MVKIKKQIVVFTMGLLYLLLSPIQIQSKIIRLDRYGNVVSENPTDSVSIANNSNAEEKRESFFPGKTKSLAFSHFTWGAEAGASIDLTSHDLPTFDADVLLGYKNKYIKLAGIGVGIHRSIHSGNNFIPIYAVLRTSFRKRPSLLFMNIQAGYSLNTVKSTGTVGDFYSALGVGINLQQTSVAKSYIILSCAYQNFSEGSRAKINIDTRDVFYAKLVVGVNF